MPQSMRRYPVCPIVISATAMAGVAIESEDMTVTPVGQSCNSKCEHSCCLRTYGLSTDPVQCSADSKGWNNKNDFGFYCSSTGTILSVTPCDCKDCCTVIDHGNGFVCHHEVLSFAAAFRVRVLM
ncbi:uncharacterized protein EDB93DRAFT_1153396 [Suillus bovinus]|uniref:uncharacterized protein n=1 Tax=Suillus bovinus TaxID=48563 RepID=UPI001B862773|nr:uncharacterized protein EDB93DRAFT_1153396 [Suillus bovinus]KAG2144420.1 hypothetical protein EDB93DRAFT_1153396 [Suillus bovinus]